MALRHFGMSVWSEASCESLTQVRTVARSPGPLAGVSAVTSPRGVTAPVTVPIVRSGGRAPWPGGSVVTSPPVGSRCQCQGRSPQGEGAGSGRSDTGGLGRRGGGLSAGQGPPRDVTVSYLG